jgi:hypothetical protein
MGPWNRIGNTWIKAEGNNQSTPLIASSKNNQANDVEQATQHWGSQLLQKSQNSDTHPSHAQKKKRSWDEHARAESDLRAHVASRKTFTKRGIPFSKPTQENQRGNVVDPLPESHGSQNSDLVTTWTEHDSRPQWWFCRPRHEQKEEGSGRTHRTHAASWKRDQRAEWTLELQVETETGTST